MAGTRLGPRGLPRRVPDFHATAVMNTVLGGLFNPRLNRLLREEKGYTYGVHSGFAFRRSAGPFVVRTAVDGEVKRPAVRAGSGCAATSASEAVSRSAR